MMNSHEIKVQNLLQKQQELELTLNHHQTQVPAQTLMIEMQHLRQQQLDLESELQRYQQQVTLN